jgi:hypothetical protein
MHLHEDDFDGVIINKYDLEILEGTRWLVVMDFVLA